MTVETRPRAERIEIRRSRALILAAAEEHYAGHNADPTMSELAILAGVGNATLYRRFPTLAGVIEELYARHVQLQQGIADDMLAQPTGWDGVVALVTGIAATIVAHPALPRVTRKMVELHPDLRHGEQWEEPLELVARRAQEEGTLRLDVDANDLTLAAFRMGEYVYLPEGVRDRVIARQVAILLDGLRATAARTPLPGGTIPTDEIQGFFRQEIA